MRPFRLAAPNARWTVAPLNSLARSAAAALGLRVEVVRAPPGTKGFVVLPRRWVVERSFGWLSKCRRVAGRDYEHNPRVSEVVIKANFCHLMLR